MSPARGRGQRGLSESLQWTILLPLVLLAVLGLVQAGVLLHGRNAAAQAALAAAEAQALAGQAGGAGEQVGRRIATEAGLADVGVQVSSGGGQVQVTVTGQVPIFFDLGQSRVSASAVQPVEE